MRLVHAIVLTSTVLLAASIDPNLILRAARRRRRARPAPPAAAVGTTADGAGDGPGPRRERQSRHPQLRLRLQHRRHAAGETAVARGRCCGGRNGCGGDIAKANILKLGRGKLHVLVATRSLGRHGAPGRANVCGIRARRAFVPKAFRPLVPQQRRWLAGWRRRRHAARVRGRRRAHRVVGGLLTASAAASGNIRILGGAAAAGQGRCGPGLEVEHEALEVREDREARRRAAASCHAHGSRPARVGLPPHHLA
mmetsp:Transcript_56540/g.183800  ORF Transcript_56540/g.183800 Transcript_56540/m.183800 type:complete len:253 (+) Transcript_56540:695-1453(+)